MLSIKTIILTCYEKSYVYAHNPFDKDTPEKKGR